MSAERDGTASIATNEVWVALVSPNENIIFTNPDAHSGFFSDTNEPGQSIERQAHSIVSRRIGSRALSSVAHLGLIQTGGLMAIGYAVRLSHRAGFDPESAGLTAQPLDLFATDDPVAQSFIDRLR